MPASAYRQHHLRQHLTGRRPPPPDPHLALAITRHPDWPRCRYCQFPVDPAAGANTDSHHSCRPDQTTAGPAGGNE